MSAEHAPLDVHHLRALVGKEMVSPWREVTQEAVSQFADVTGDRQWIHVDVERARRESPFGGTVAGAIDGTRMGINYGVNRVRFPSPLPSGSMVRARCTLQKIEPADGGVQATWSVVIERDGSAKPCCVAEWLVRYLL
jgi:acyl dehydratase